jgi:penicillin-binding protein 1A
MFSSSRERVPIAGRSQNRRPERDLWLHSLSTFGAETGRLRADPLPAEQSFMSRRDRQRRRTRNQGHPLRRTFLLTAAVCLCAIGLGVAGVAGWVVNVAESAPDINQLKPRDPGQLSEVIGSDGSLLGYISSDILRTTVSGSDIPQVLKQATVAIEDRRFYKHGGIDYEGILRAGVQDVLGGGNDIQGGSTLTMQLVRNIYLPNQLADTRSLKRKIIEAKLAEELEQKHSKSWILTQYLNDVDYGTLGGQTAVGVAAASQLFFNKPVSQLDLPQAALLAGLPQAPSEYNPFLASDLAKARRHEVLKAMVQSHYISPAQADKADRSALQVQRNDAYTLKREPYVFDYVRDALIKKFGLATV